MLRLNEFIKGQRPHPTLVEYLDIKNKKSLYFCNKTKGTLVHEREQLKSPSVYFKSTKHMQLTIASELRQ